VSRILFTSMPMAGHLRPGLAIATELVAAGHDVSWYTGAKYADVVARSGARFVPMDPALDFDDADVGGLEDGGKPGLAKLRQDLLDVFITPVRGWVHDLDRVLDDVRPDVVVAEQGFTAGPLAAERRGIPRVVFSVTPLTLSSVDTAPFGTGLLPGSGVLSRLRNRALNRLMRSIVFAEPQRVAEQIRAELGLPAQPGYFMDWGPLTADAFLCPSVAEFEYPRRELPGNVEFIGPLLPRDVDAWDPPAWWGDVLAAGAAGRPVVLVTQGTIATEPTNLVLPAVRGLATSDALVIATTVGFDADLVLPGDERPANLRLTPFVPFDRLLPLVDVVVTNGGYGGVQSALAHGVPLVVAGLTEDKMEVSSRVTWAGVGVALRTDTPRADQLRAAVDQVLGDGFHAERARALQARYAAHRGARRAVEVVLEVAARGATVG
jgi:MGT family glycosyltransferase